MIQRAPTTCCLRSPSSPDIAALSTLLDNFFEESTADVFTFFIAVSVLVTELSIMRILIFQTIHDVGHEPTADL